MSAEVNRQTLVSCCLADFGEYSAKQCTQDQILDFFEVFLCLIVLFGFCSKLAFELDNLKINFCSFPNGSWSQPTRFGKLIYSGLWGVVCQPVHAESNIRLFHSFSLFGITFCFFVQTCPRVGKGNFEIIFSLSLRSFNVSRQGLVNWSLTGVGAYSAKQCTPNQI